MEINSINFNENINKENELLLKNNQSTFNLNLNPFTIDERSKEKIDKYSLEYLRKIAKKPNLIIRNEETEEYSNKNFISKSSSSILTNETTKSGRKSSKKARVSFKDKLVEPEKKKGIYFIILKFMC